MSEIKTVKMSRDELEQLKKNTPPPMSKDVEVENLKQQLAVSLDNQKELTNEIDRNTTADAIQDKILSGKATKLSDILSSHPRLKKYYSCNARSTWR